MLLLIFFKVFNNFYQSLIPISNPGVYVYVFIDKIFIY